MTNHTGSETSAMEPAVHSQDSPEPSEFPPPSPKASLEILMMPDKEASRFPRIRWKRLSKKVPEG
jgi:hypothetical protein